mgnify:CR=1 FL=1
MKFIITLIFAIALSSFSFGQSRTYNEYVQNGPGIFSSLDSNYLYFLKELNVQSLTEWKYYFDTTGVVTDSIICNHLKFDTTGKLIEKRFDFRGDNKKYMSKKYIYSNQHVTDSIFNNPFLPTGVLDGIYVSTKLPQNCVYYNKYYQIETINVQQQFDGPLMLLQYHYNPELFYKDYDYVKFLISGLDYTIGDHLRFQHKIIYELRNK